MLQYFLNEKIVTQNFFIVHCSKTKKIPNLRSSYYIFASLLILRRKIGA